MKFIKKSWIARYKSLNLERKALPGVRRLFAALQWTKTASGNCRAANNRGVIGFLFCLLVFSKGYATEYSPWFPPPFEFQGRMAYLYEHVEKVQSPQGSFRVPTNNSSLNLGLDVTPLPYFNIEAELFLTHTSDITFAYEAALISMRYAWLDDIYGDCITLVTGATLSFPGKRFLHQFSFPYHGNTNAEFHVTLGKEWTCRDDWAFRLWGLGGYGVANRGSPWIHGLGVVEFKPSRCLSAGFFSESLYGLGDRNIIPHEPFPGYASINHQSIDIGGFANYEFPYFGTLSAACWYNVYARNFIIHYWGAGLSLLIPFSLI